MKRNLLSPLEKKEGNIEESGDETEMGDVSSNLEGYPGCKEDFGKNEGEGSGEKNEGSRNDGNEEF